MGRGVVLVAEGAARFALLTAAAGHTLVIQDRCREAQQPILKIVEGAHARDVVGLKATQHRIERLLPQALHPDFDRGDVALQHQQPGAQQIVRRASWPPVVRHIQAGQDRISRREIGMAKLAPQWGRIMRHFDLERGAAGLNKFEILAVGTRWPYHEKAPSCRAKTRSTRPLALTLA